MIALVACARVVIVSTAQSRQSPHQSNAQKTQSAAANQPQAQPPITVTVTTPQKSTAEQEAERQDRAQEIAIQGRIGQFTLGLVIVGVLQAIAIAIGLGYTARAANAAKKSAKVAEDALTKLQRPFVCLNTYRWVWHPDTGRPGKFWYSIEPILENTGSVPTKDMMVVVQYELRDTLLPGGFDFPFTVKPGEALINPHGSVAVSGSKLLDEALAAVQRGEKYFYVWGRAEYRDFFDGTPLHVTRFCAQIGDVLGNPYNPILTPGSTVGSSVEIPFRIHHKHNSVE